MTSAHTDLVRGGAAAAAVASWLVALALVLSSPAKPGSGLDTPAGAASGAAGAARSQSNIVTWLAVVAIGATAAAVLAGPSLGGAWWLRVATTVVATGLAFGVSGLRSRRERPIDALAIASGLGAVALVAADAPGWSGTVDGAGVQTGLLVAVAVTAVATVGARATTAMRDHWA